MKFIKLCVYSINVKIVLIKGVYVCGALILNSYLVLC